MPNIELFIDEDRKFKMARLQYFIYPTYTKMTEPYRSLFGLENEQVIKHQQYPFKFNYVDEFSFG